MYRYDVFISYRHGDPDRGRAVELDEILRKFGISTAIDERDFSPQETFFDEMARCVKTSRFTIALLSNRYSESFNTREEAVMQKCLDNYEKKRRLIPVYLEPCEPPLWLVPLVGIYLYERESKPNPIKKLVRTIHRETKTNAGLDEKQVEMKLDAKWKEHATGIALGLGGYAAYDYLSKPRAETGTVLDSSTAEQASSSVDAVIDSSGDADLDTDTAVSILDTIKDFFSDV